MNQSRTINAGKIDRSIRRFMDYSQDVLNSDMNTFADRIQVLMSYCESDPVFSVIHKQLVDEESQKYIELTNDLTAQCKWFGEKVFTGLSTRDINLNHSLHAMAMRAQNAKKRVQVDASSIQWSMNTSSFYLGTSMK